MILLRKILLRKDFINIRFWENPIAVNSLSPYNYNGYVGHVSLEEEFHKN